MGIFDFFKINKRAEDKDSLDLLIIAKLIADIVGKEEAMNIPSFSACVEKIVSTISTVPIILYEVDENNSVQEVKDDIRVKLLNNDSKDTLTGTQFKKAIITDYLLDKGGYAFINRRLNKIVSLHYVDASKITFMENADPIFKNYSMLVNGQKYHSFDFIKVLRNTKNGYKGTSIIEEHTKLLSVAYNSLIFENNLVKTGGNKKGFLQVAAGTGRLSKDSIDELRKAFNDLYSNNDENVVVLNSGIEFKEASNTSVEMQLNENKKTNGDEICKIFNIKPSIINGSGTEQDKTDFIQYCIYPILIEFVTSLDRDLLLEEEKGKYFFSPDLTELVKGDIEKRYKAYAEAIKSGFLQLDDVRKKEKLPNLNLPYIKLGLQDVLFDPISKTIYTPNTGVVSNLESFKDSSVLDSNDKNTGG